MTKNKTMHRLETANYHIDVCTKEELQEVKKILQGVNIRYVDNVIRKRR